MFAHTPHPVRTEPVEVPEHPEPVEGTEPVEVPEHPELVDVHAVIGVGL